MQTIAAYWISKDIAWCTVTCIDPDLDNVAGCVAVAYDEAVDAPVACARCGVLVPLDLTAAGLQYVVDHLDGVDSRIGEQWRKQYGHLIGDLTAQAAKGHHR